MLLELKPEKVLNSHTTKHLELRSRISMIKVVLHALEKLTNSKRFNNISDPSPKCVKFERPNIKKRISGVPTNKGNADEYIVKLKAKSAGVQNPYLKELHKTTIRITLNCNDSTINVSENDAYKQLQQQITEECVPILIPSRIRVRMVQNSDSIESMDIPLDISTFFNSVETCTTSNPRPICFFIDNTEWKSWYNIFTSKITQMVNAQPRSRNALLKFLTTCYIFVIDDSLLQINIGRKRTIMQLVITKALKKDCDKGTLNIIQ